MASPVRQRIIGAIVIIALLAIFIPIFFTSHHQDQVVSEQPPTPPAMPVVHLKLPPMPASDVHASTHQGPAASVTTIESNQASTSAPVGQQSADHFAPVVSAQTVPTNNAWRLQLGSFSYKTNSDRLIKRLKQAGFEAYAHTVKLGHGKKLQQVYIGPAMSKVEARQLQQHLSDKMHMPSMVKPYHMAFYKPGA
jgi:DedD protein